MTSQPSSGSSHPLPAKPSSTPYSGKPSHGSALAFKPPSVAAKAAATSSSWQTNYSSPAVPSRPASSSPYPAATSTYGSQAGYGNQYYQQPPTTTSPPQIANPFPLPGQGPSKEKFDPAFEAQLAQWQSAYVSKDDYRRPPPTGADQVPVNERAAGKIDIGSAAAPGSGVAAVVSGADGKKKTVIRSGGGKTWQDPSLLEWDPSHPRLFVGNLAGEVTDDSLFKAFAKYPSVVKARVVRDKRTTKSKGFGFVSFSNSDDYFQAAREMQGKYIGSHPILIKRSTTEIKAVNPQQQQKKKGHGGGGAFNGGIQKRTPKTKGGMKFLG